MIIDGNQCTEIGDVLLMTTQVPIIATTSLLTFTDSIIGTTGTRFFTKLFQYSPDGIVFGDWQALTNANLQLITFESWNTPVVNLRYERSGTDTTGILEFDGITFGGTAITYTPDSPIGAVSLFKDILYNTPETFDLMINLAQKLFGIGIVPQYIERGDTDVDLTINDDDYIAFWKTVAHFFALFSVYGQRWLTLFFNRDWLLQYAAGYGFFFNGDEDMADIQYVIANMYSEYRKRGTALVVMPKGRVLLDGSTTPVTGEYLRLIGWNGWDDFIFQLRKKQFTGWWLDCSSPNYKGLTHMGVQINKAPENTQDVLDLSKYLTTGSPTLITDSSKHVVRLSPGDSIGFKTPISLLQDYELTFWCKEDTVLATILQVSGLPYNHSGSLIGSTLQDTIGTYTSIFISGLTVADNTVYYFVRVILYKQSTSQPNTTTNMGQGVNLRSMPGQEVMKWIIKNTSLSDHANLWDIKCRPLRTVYSTGFMQPGNLIEIWRKNNNGHYSSDQSNQLARKYLFPYNSIQLTTDI